MLPHKDDSFMRRGKEAGLYSRRVFRTCLLLAYGMPGRDYEFADCLRELSVGQIANFIALVRTPLAADNGQLSTTSCHAVLLRHVMLTGMRAQVLQIFVPAPLGLVPASLI